MKQIKFLIVMTTVVIFLLFACNPLGEANQVSDVPSVEIGTITTEHLTAPEPPTVRIPSYISPSKTPEMASQEETQDINATPTHICSHYYESDPYLFFATSTPTYIEYSNETDDIFITVTRAIYYDDERSYCFNQPSSDFYINIRRGSKHYIYSTYQILENTPKLSAGGVIGIKNILIKDMDRDGESEIVWNIDQRGASCCTFTVVMYYDAQIDMYVPTEGIVNKYSYAGRIVDLNEDGMPEIVTRNTGWGSAVTACGALDGIAPILIFNYDHHKIVESTSLYTEVVLQDAQKWVNFFETHESNVDAQVFSLAAYVGDMEIIGRGDEGWKLYNEKCPQVSDKEYGHMIKSRVVERLQATPAY